jgi:titin
MIVSRRSFGQTTTLRAIRLCGCAMVLSGLCVSAATFVVTNTSDSGDGSLRQAITSATSGTDTINFAIPGPGVQTITVVSLPLPTITVPVVIDGTTQPGYSNTPLIELSGANLVSVGLFLAGGGSMVRGLAINRFTSYGIQIQGPGGNQIAGNFIGTDPTGTLSEGNKEGIWIYNSSGNVIGGTNAADRNVISGNSDAGVYLQGNANGNIIQGNYLGTDASGASALGNVNGVAVYAAPNTQIGGLSVIGGAVPGPRNVISGNSGSGIYLVNASGSLVQGNYLGTDRLGAVALPNHGDGITLLGASATTVGGTNTGAGNLISGNNLGGVSLQGASANNQVQGNLIGPGAAGTNAVANLASGVNLLSSSGNLIGGASVAARNVISGNLLDGILITNSSGNTVAGNYIGVDATGTNMLGNIYNGIDVEGTSSGTLVGGLAASALNVISGNTNGIALLGGSGTVIQGNYIGTDKTGQKALGNTQYGVDVASAGNTIGSVTNGYGNIISGNSLDGVIIVGTGVSNNLVQGNFIGTKAGGNSILLNNRSGLGIFGASGNTIGGVVAGAGNVICGNGTYAIGQGGIYLQGGASGNFIQGNWVGTDRTGTLALGNTQEGIYLMGAVSNVIGGSLPGAGNVTSANGTRGIWLDMGASWNVVQGNLIGTKSDGVSPLGNTDHNIEVGDSAGGAGAINNTIGGGLGAGNTIAFAGTIYAGVRVRDGSTNNAILGNSIFGNGGLGIDLSTVGPGPINNCGVNPGANMLQNFPVLSQAVSGNGTGIRGTLNSRPNSTFLIQFFANPACDKSLHGQGQTYLYLGDQMVATGGACTNAFVATFPGQVPPGYVITATATDSAYNTSEFSTCAPVAPVPALAISTNGISAQLNLAWTNTATGFVLKQTGSLSPPAQWTTVTNPPVNANGQFVVALPIASTNQFFVLSFE